MKYLNFAAVGVFALGALSANAQISDPYDGDLAGFTNGDGTIAGAVAIAVAVNKQLRDAMQFSQFGEGSACIGQDSKLCMPQVDSTDLRAILLGNVAFVSSIDAEIPSDGVYPSGAPTTNCPPGAAQGGPGTLWEITRCELPTPYAGRFLRSIIPDEVSAAAAEFLGGGACGPNAKPAGTYDTNANAALVDGTSAAALAAIGAVTNRHVFGLVPVTEINGASGVGFVKLDGSSPDLLSYSSGNYDLGQNVVGAGALPAAESTPFGNVGVAAGLGQALPHHRTGGGTALACATLQTGSIGQDNGN